MAMRRQEAQRPPRRGGPPQEVMQFWGAFPCLAICEKLAISHSCQATSSRRSPPCPRLGTRRLATTSRAGRTMSSTTRSSTAPSSAPGSARPSSASAAKSMPVRPPPTHSTPAPLVPPGEPMLTRSDSLGLQATRARRPDQLGRAQDIGRDPQPWRPGQLPPQAHEVLDPVIPPRRPQDHRRLPHPRRRPRRHQRD